MLFDGGSLVLYMCGVVVYITNIVKGLRIVSEGKYGVGYDDPIAEEANGAGYTPDGVDVLGKEDNLKVLAASNTILALVLVGVLVLQAGQWYAERADEKEQKKLKEESHKTGNSGSESAGGNGGHGLHSGGGGKVERKPSNRESKKAR